MCGTKEINNLICITVHKKYITFLLKALFDSTYPCNLTLKSTLYVTPD